jgi:hypothetical protein
VYLVVNLQSGGVVVPLVIWGRISTDGTSPSSPYNYTFTSFFLLANSKKTFKNAKTVQNKART